MGQAYPEGSITTIADNIKMNECWFEYIHHSLSFVLFYLLSSEPSFPISVCIISEWPRNKFIYSYIGLTFFKGAPIS